MAYCCTEYKLNCKHYRLGECRQRNAYTPSGKKIPSCPRAAVIEPSLVGGQTWWSKIFSKVKTK